MFSSCFVVLWFVFSLATNQQPRQNMHKALLNFANKACLLPRAFMPSITFKPPYNKLVQMMLLPHLVFSQIYHCYKNAWDTIICPSQDQLKTFWNLQKKHPAYPGHAVLGGNPQFPTKMVPLALHGDGTPVLGIGKVWSRQLTTWSWNSLLGVGSTKSMQMQVWSCFDETMASTTLAEFWQILAWSFKWLQLGVFPDSDHLGNKYAANTQEGQRAGQNLAGGYCGILWSLVGDLEYLTQVLKLPHYSSKSGPCSLCKCTGDSSAMSWKDCRLTAPWIQSQWKPHGTCGKTNPLVLFFSNCQGYQLWQYAMISCTASTLAQTWCSLLLACGFSATKFYQMLHHWQTCRHAGPNFQLFTRMRKFLTDIGACQNCPSLKERRGVQS